MVWESWSKSKTVYDRVHLYQSQQLIPFQDPKYIYGGRLARLKMQDE